MMLTAAPEAWPTYPLCLPRGDVDANDLAQYHADLNARAPYLFAADEANCHVELCTYTAGRPPPPNDTAGAEAAGVGAGGGNTFNQAPGAWTSKGKFSAPVCVYTAEGLRSVLATKLPHGATRVFTIYRMNSWSRMQITGDMFRMLCAASRATPRMVDLVRGMQYKSAPGDEHFMGCYYDINGHENCSVGARYESSPEPTPDLGFEVCYNLRHFEKHGRDIKDPWSCRQSVIHHRFVFADAQSSWIVVHPSARWQAVLTDVNMDGIVHPLSLHLRSISSAVANNWEYLEYLSSQLLTLDQRAAFPKPLANFDFDFTLNQNVHSIRKRLHHIKTILDGSLCTVSALLSLAEAIRKLGSIPTPAHDAVNRELGHTSRELQAYKSTTEELLNLSSDIKSTINSILDFRNQDMLKSNGIHLHRIAEDNSRETQAMADTAKHTYNDSRTMRIATVIALIYLPANLVLTFFSTIFVNMKLPNGATVDGGSVQQSAVSKGDGAQLVIYGHIWVAIVSMVVLNFITGGWFWFWDRKTRAGATSSTC